jgi:uncharacterized membrane protein YkvA (DUF1232 family)
VDVVAGIIIGVVLLWLVLVGALWLLRPRGVGLVDVLRLVPDVIRLGRDLLADRSTPLAVRLAVLGLVGWLLSPIDLIPEFVPVLGPLDDAIVAVLVLRFTHRRLGDERFRAIWRGSPAGYEVLARLIGASR